jgi:predicted DNA-binding transcriptional regulator AlpA
MKKNRRNSVNGNPTTKVGWRVPEWAADVGVSRAYVYNLMNAQQIGSVKIGKCRVITTTPAAYLASLAGDVA